MPIFEYLCQGCDHEFEELVRNAKEKVPCPECGSKKVGKLMSRVAFKSSGKFSSSAGPSDCGSCSSSPSSCSGCSAC